MPTIRRQVLALVMLALATGLLLVTGWGWRIAGRLGDGLAEPWQVGEHGEPASTEVLDLRERIIRLNVENVVLRRRLAEFGEIPGGGRVPLAHMVVARGSITARTLRQGRRYCELDVGAVDGVALEDPVVLGWSLVGRVTGLSHGRSLVQLVADAESRVPAGLYDAEACIAEGVLRGTGEASMARLDLVEDRPGLLVQEGQSVVASGLQGLPAGLVLGTVVRADRGETADHWLIEVKLLRDPDLVESLVVLRPTPEGAEGAAPVAEALKITK